MQKNVYGCAIRFPDGSYALLDYETYRFYPTEREYLFEIPAKKYVEMIGIQQPAVSLAFLRSTKDYMNRLEWPRLQFRDNFRKHPRGPFIYYHRPEKSTVDLFEINTYYRLYYQYQGGMFCSTIHTYKFMDGKLVHENPYGFIGGGKSFTYVEGPEALRVLCLFNGIKQPVRMNNYERTKTDAELMIEFSQWSYKFEQPDRFRIFKEN